MWKQVVGGLGVLVLGLVGLIAAQPAEFEVERSAKMDAPVEIVFAEVSNFRAWEVWSPWDKLDPALKRSYSGADSGEGAKYAWEGNDEVGSGRMTIVKATPNQRIEIKLEFLKPFEATNMTIFGFQSTGASSNVSWKMTGTNNFLSKAFSLFVDMEDLVGNDFEKGLSQLKKVSEDKAGARREEARIAAEAALKAAAEAALQPNPAVGPTAAEAGILK
ncbi:MAG: SRPBCC family protein [Deltaproteobacteria bacterium]|nr:SRPBCC family protein [Deltaproteobacteria bacterium]